MQDGLLPGNPCDAVKRPKREKPQWKIMDEEQIRLFLGTAKRTSRDYRLFLAAAYTGARQGELLAMRWSNVDLAMGTASIEQTLQRRGRQIVFKDPKSEKSRRTVPLHPVLVAELRQLKEEQERRGESWAHSITTTVWSSARTMGSRCTGTTSLGDPYEPS